VDQISEADRHGHSATTVAHNAARPLIVAEVIAAPAPIVVAVDVTIVDRAQIADHRATVVDRAPNTDHRATVVDRAPNTDHHETVEVPAHIVDTMTDEDRACTAAHRAAMDRVHDITDRHNADRAQIAAKAKVDAT
jgi:hypothetical protein